MNSRYLFMTLGLSLVFWILGRALRYVHRLPRPGESGRAALTADISAAVMGFLATMFALKALPLLAPPTGLLRQDFLFPLWALWRDGDGVHWLIGAAAVGTLLALAAGYRHHKPKRATAFALMATLPAIALWLSLSMTNGGWPEGPVEPMARSADYHVDVERFASPAALWSEYVGTQESLSLHGRTHPPGALTVLWILNWLTGGRIALVTLGVILLSSLGVLPVLIWARRFLPSDTAAGSVLLWILTPAVAIYGATSMDMVFALPLLAAGALFARSLADGARQVRQPVWRQGIAPGLLLGLGFLFTFSTAVLATAFLAAVLLSPAAARRRGMPLLAATAAGSLVLPVLMYLATGFDLTACLRLAMTIDGAEAPATLSWRNYALTRLMGGMDFLVMAGIAFSPLWLRVLRRGFSAPAAGTSATELRDQQVLLALGRGAAAAMMLFLLAGAFKIGETGRIFLFMLPFVIIPAVRYLQALGRLTATGLWPLTVAAFWHLGQTLVLEWFLDTRW